MVCYKKMFLSSYMCVMNPIFDWSYSFGHLSIIRFSYYSICWSWPAAILQHEQLQDQVHHRFLILHGPFGAKIFQRLCNHLGSKSCSHSLYMGMHPAHSFNLPILPPLYMPIPTIPTKTPHISFISCAVQQNGASDLHVPSHSSRDRRHLSRPHFCTKRHLNSKGQR